MHIIRAHRCVPNLQVVEIHNHHEVLVHVAPFALKADGLTIFTLFQLTSSTRQRKPN